MKILITGSTGLVGTALAQHLQRAGHTVCRLIRPGTSSQTIGNSQAFDVNWNPTTGELGGAAVGADAVQDHVHRQAQIDARSVLLSARFGIGC